MGQEGILGSKLKMKEAQGNRTYMVKVTQATMCSRFEDSTQVIVINTSHTTLLYV